MGPINTRDPAAAAKAYATILGWPITLGHRYRPRGGCTCGSPQCPRPGAHPLDGRLADTSQDAATTPGVALIAATAAFDALLVPKRVGMATLVSLDHIAPVPCLTDGDRAALFVLPATGRYALGSQPSPVVELRSGPEEWLALPPSRGTGWDTPPWNEQTRHPVALLHGGDVRPHLEAALAYESPFDGRRQP